ncbi:hypothetical protein EV359DRAFT_85804 [Lentinula novae-zelandiae]|nr:hypothetical protein EV359DRAFT_85804 [Lentinula novae-zelandiae]
MLVTVQGHSCVASKDLASYYSVLSRQYVRSNGLNDWRSSCVTLSVNIRLHNFAFTTRVDFILVNDLQNCDVVFGLQFSNSCHSSECEWLLDHLPAIKVPLIEHLPLPPLPFYSGRPAIIQSTLSCSSDPPLNSIPAMDTSLQDVIVANGVSDTYNTTKNMVGPGSFDNPGYVAEHCNNNLSDNEASSSSLPHSTPRASIPSSVQIISSCLFGNSASGVKCSMFFSEHPNFSAYAELHGLDMMGLFSH